MAWQQSDLDALDTAIVRNERSVTFADGRRVEYQDADKMLAVRNAIKAELLASASQIVPRRRATRAVVCR